MKGMEFKQMLGIILLVAVLILAAALIFLPSTAFGRNASQKTSFEEFCVFWSLQSYMDTGDVQSGGNTYNVREYCASALGQISASTLNTEDIDRCRKCCKKEIIC